MRAINVLAGLALGFTIGFAQSDAQAAGSLMRAGDIVRSIETLAAKSQSGAENGELPDAEGVPLPLLRKAGRSSVPLPAFRGYQLASLSNEYLAAMPTVIKPRVLDGETAGAQDGEDAMPQPRIITWMPQSGDDDELVVRSGRRNACFHCLLRRTAREYGVPFRLARAVIQVESNYRRDAVGSVGEIGLMQLRPQTARWLGFDGEDEELFNPRLNLEYGVKYLGKAWRLGEGKLCQAILRYNAGHNARKMNPMSQRYCNKVEAILKAGDAGRIQQASL